MLRKILKFLALKVLVIQIKANLFHSSTLLPHSHQMTKYPKLLQDIYGEYKFESILVVYKKQAIPHDLSLAIEELEIPNVLITMPQAAFFFRGTFNVNILAILIMNISMDLELMEGLAITLDYMRQTRILAIALDVHDDKDLYKQQLLLHCKSHNMTNVVLQFMNSQEDMELDHLYMLKPYPQYHWILKQHQIRYYQQHWKNMQNVSLLTFVDQSKPRSLYFKDEQGNLRINGFVARLILLFAERLNATLHMAYPLSLESPLHYSVILKNMVRRNLLDIPMVEDTSPYGSKWLNFTNVYDYDQGMFIVPCAQELSTGEVYTILLNKCFLGSIFMSTFVLSLLHSLIDYIFEDVWQPTRLIFNERIFPGVLGLSFVARCSNCHSRQFVYILLFIIGFYLNTKFSVKVSSLFTSPPQHRHLETMQDIMNSPLKLLLQENEAADMSPFTTNYVQAIVITSNNTYLRDLRQNLNTSYGYFASLGYWKILTRQQQFYSHKVFCTFENLTLFPYLPWAIPLQLNSPYTEALNYLIHQVHSFGLNEAWLSSTFIDMLKLKHISLRDPHMAQGPTVLTADDLFWIWILLSSGLVVSCIVFFVEILWGLLLTKKCVKK
uniref:Ionotropic receptor n=1 Tax=Stomoxys calcitrans TaxID=35570 RepID=A0A2Y9D4M8_STOCA